MLKEMRQLRMLTMEDINAQARALGMEQETGKSGLLDSGASHAFRAGSPEEVDSANRVRVQLATGDYVTLAQNRGGTSSGDKVYGSGPDVSHRALGIPGTGLEL